MANEALKSEESPPDTGSNPSTYIRPQARKLHDPAVSFEEYHYYAVRTREEELHLPAPKTNWREILLRKKPATELQPDTNAPRGVPDNEKYDKPPPDINLANPQRRLEITDEEWTNASRAFRSASWGACWYLITVDILGPYGVGFAMGTLGWGPGIALYTAFGGLAGYSGYLLHRCFLGLDSHQFPCKNYGDLALRIYGRTARYICNVLQAIALLLVLGQITIQQGQGLSQVSRFRLCYAVCPVLFIIVGFFLGQIRTLKQYGWVATLAVWLNLLVIFISMGVIAHSPPNYAISTLGSSGAATNPATIAPDAAGNYPPIIHYSGLPTSKSLVGAINGLLSGIFAYAGAQLFIEFMAEMRRPRDFLKAMWGAQFFIYSVYLIYGCYVYYFQGQYSYQISYQGVSPYGWQTACNMIAIFSGLIAAGLYGNIGIKVLYNNVLMDLFNAPPLITKTGKIFWVILVPIWWSVGYIIAAAIPDYFGFVSVVSAATAIQFSYTFPPMLALGYSIRLNIMRCTVGDEGFDPRTGTVNRPLSGMKYWIKGFFAGGPLAVMLNIWHLIYALGAWVLAGLGMYAAIKGLIDAFAMPQVNSFSCISPLDLAA
ncbi:amino acid transporter [Teratosphaeria destructans]|uniref:Amino acid transporter n=1 Tax=Teratosphaeria destructans TaxID=418781 RepID=A0A9W7SLX5_9PEZI|nr:amino acid transporter [Teratosphaeria destructans]